MGRKATGGGSSNKATRRPKIDPPPDHWPDAFKPVAELITPDPPEWLAEHLLRWATTIYMCQAVERRQPTRAQMVKILAKVRDAADLLRRALGEPSVCEFLNAGASTPLDASYKFQIVLGELQIRAGRALKLPNLIDSKGKVKAGRGRALPDGAISGQTYCALLIAEAWKRFHGEYPASRNRKAAKAVDLYWRLAGGQRDISWGNDPLAAWRYHLKEAESIPAEQDRAEIRRHMLESARFADHLKSEAAREGGK